MRRVATSLPAQIVAALILATGVGVAAFRTRLHAVGAPTGSLYAALAATHPPRTLVVRTSLEVAYRTCRAERPDLLVPPAVCDDSAGLPGEGARIAAEARRRMAARLDPDATHAAALVDLLSRPGPVAVNRSIRLLRPLVAASADSVAAMVDLAAAFLLQGGQTQSLEPLLQSLEYSDRALDARPGDPAALFNRALALEALAADVQASAAWRAYLARDSVSGWAAEAARHLAALAPAPRAAVPGPGATSDAVAAFARRHPQEALNSGWEDLLPAWGSAVLAGDTAAAGERLRRAGVLGDALARQGGDRSLADQVRLIRELVARGADPRPLANDLERYRGAREASRKASFASADSLFAAIQPGAAHAPLDLWADVGRAASRLNLRDETAPWALLDRAVAGAEARGYTSLAARTWWVRGTLLQRVGRPGEAPRAYQTAESLFTRLGERANRGMMQAMIYDALHSAGNPSAGYPWLHRAAVTVRPLGFTLSRHSAMAGLARAAWGERLPRATHDLTEEDVAVATALGAPAYVAEARTNRAVLRAQLGDSGGALGELAQVAPILAATDTATRRYLSATTAYARGVALLQPDPRAAAAEFGELLAYTGKAQELWRTRALSWRARARLACGDLDGARADLDRVFGALDRARLRRSGAWPREVEGEVRPALLRLVSLLVARGDHRAALAYLERGSAALASFPLAHARTLPAVPRGRVVLRPLLIGDTLLVWTVRHTGVALARTVVPRAGLDAFARATALPGQADAQAWADLALLHDLLIRPVAPELAPGDELVVVNDAELAGVPFAALLDRRTRAPLVAAHTVWRAPSVAAAARPAGPARPPARATFVAPSFNRALNPDLDDLPEARNEVAEVSRGYGSTILAGGDAVPAAMEQALRQSTLLHFAGHAVSDNEHPDRSYLVMAPGAGAPDGRLAATRLEALDLSRLRLVVLSACSTLGGDTRAGGFTGLSGALLGAGAKGVVGSLWPVDDGATRELMRAFHRSFLRTGDAPRALREAQLELLGSGNPHLASPASWAAFQYVGG